MAAALALGALGATVPALAGDTAARSEHDRTFARAFPDTTRRTGVFLDQITVGADLTPAQIRFAATHTVGTQKIPLALTEQLRAVNPNYLMLHYHLVPWQSGERVDYIIDGTHWGNDYATVDRHEDWFLHDADGRRLKDADGKLLMNPTNREYVDYLTQTLIEQSRAGAYDGVFADSWATPSVQYYLAHSKLYSYPEIVRPQAELGGLSFAQANQRMLAELNQRLNAAGLYLLPNLGNLVTGWDKTDYSIPNGGMLEGGLDWNRWGQAQWIDSISQVLPLIAAGKILIFESYLNSPTDTRTRLYRLGSYLLIRGRHTYLTYFAHRPFEYYPEFDIDLGDPLVTAHRSIAELKQGPLYVRAFERGLVVVNSSDDQAYSYSVPGSYAMAVVHGGGTVGPDGRLQGTLEFVPVEGSIELPPTSALILLRINA